MRGAPELEAVLKAVVARCEAVVGDGLASVVRSGRAEGTVLVMGEVDEEDGEDMLREAREGA